MFLLKKKYIKDFDAHTQNEIMVRFLYKIPACFVYFCEFLRSAYYFLQLWLMISKISNLPIKIH